MSLFGKNLTQKELEVKIEDLEAQIAETEAEIKAQGNKLATALGEGMVTGRHSAEAIQQKIAALTGQKAMLLKTLPKAKAAFEREARSLGRAADKKTREKALKEVEAWFKTANKRRAQLRQVARTFVEGIKEYRAFTAQAPSGAYLTGQMLPFDILHGRSFIRRFSETVAHETWTPAETELQIHQVLEMIKKDVEMFDQYARGALGAMRMNIYEIASEEASDPDPLAQVAG